MGASVFLHEQLSSELLQLLLTSSLRSKKVDSVWHGGNYTEALAGASHSPRDIASSLCCPPQRNERSCERKACLGRPARAQHVGCVESLPAAAQSSRFLRSGFLQGRPCCLFPPPRRSSAKPSSSPPPPLPSPIAAQPPHPTASTPSPQSVPPPVAFEADSPAGLRLRHAIQAKLPEFLGCEAENVLPEYICVLLSHGKSKANAAADLEAFLEAGGAARFTAWCAAARRRRGCLAPRACWETRSSLSASAQALGLLRGEQGQPGQRSSSGGGCDARSRRRRRAGGGERSGGARAAPFVASWGNVRLIPAHRVALSIRESLSPPE